MTPTAPSSPPFVAPLRRPVQGRQLRSPAARPGDLLVAVGLATALLGVGLAGVDGEVGHDLSTARHELVNDLREARMQATLLGSRMRFEARGDQYVITRLRDRDGSGTWEADASAAAKRVQLPAGLSVDVLSPRGGAVAEFDERGLLVRRDGSVGIAIVVTDRSGRRELLQIWPSGQVEEPRNRRRVSVTADPFPRPRPIAGHS